MALSKRVLIVDDESGVRALLSDALASNGFQVSLACDGRECLDQLVADHFDLVITDIRMPRVNGIEILRWMKKAGRKEKIIIMTGSPLELNLSEPDMPAVVTQLKKPFNMDRLLNTVVAATAGAAGMGKQQARA